MLQYTVQDLINQAKSKADLENSDFIRHADNISVLNDCWLSLYQKSIDAGEKFFLKEAVLEGSGTFILPDDFFQLHSLTQKNGIQIPRRTTTEIEKGLMGYEIKNNKIIIFNVHTEVTIQYYPTPATLTFPFNPVKYSLTDTFKAGKGNIVFSDQKYMNIDTNEIESITGLSENASFYQVYDKYVVYIKYLSSAHTLDNAYYYIYDLQSMTLEKAIETAGSVILQNYNRDVIYLDSDTGKVYNLDDEEQITVEVPEVLSSNMVLNNDGTVTVLEGLSCLWIDSDLFFQNSKNRIVVYNTDTKETKDSLFNQKGFLLEYNDLTGRGIWFNNTLFSSSSNVLLNYPNNLFFSVLMYDLAISYKIKQNQDTTLLESKKAEFEYQYFDSLTQDDFEVVRIRNAYY